MPGLTIGDTIPNLNVETTYGKFKLHDFVGDTSYLILFSHPGDFTSVCMTELGQMAAYAEEFKKRGVKLLGLSCDDVHSHKEWIKDIEAHTPGCKVEYPIIADPNREISVRCRFSLKRLQLFSVDEGFPSPLRIEGLSDSIFFCFFWIVGAIVSNSF